MFEGHSNRESADVPPVPSSGERGPKPLSSDREEATSSPLEELPPFNDTDVGDALATATDERLNNAPFGIIQLDDDGVVQFFNRYESNLSGVSPEEAEGCNFFTQVAPCTNNWLFRGRFRKGVRQDDLDETFTYTYTYEMEPTLVDVYLYRDASRNNWIMVKEH